MPKVTVRKDEYWPYPVLVRVGDPRMGGTTILVDSRTLKRWNRVIEEFEQVDKEIWSAVDKAEGKSET